MGKVISAPAQGCSYVCGRHKLKRAEYAPNGITESTRQFSFIKFFRYPFAFALREHVDVSGNKLNKFVQVRIYLLLLARQITIFCESVSYGIAVLLVFISHGMIIDMPQIKSIDN